MNELEEDLKDQLCSLRRWLISRLSDIKARNSPWGHGGNSWGIIEVPDWEARQKLEVIDGLLLSLGREVTKTPTGHSFGHTDPNPQP